jgi:hypothetical protein
MAAIRMPTGGRKPATMTIRSFGCSRSESGSTQVVDIRSTISPDESVSIERKFDAVEPAVPQHPVIVQQCNARLVHHAKYCSGFTTTAEGVDLCDRNDEGAADFIDGRPIRPVDLSAHTIFGYAPARSTTADVAGDAPGRR